MFATLYYNIFFVLSEYVDEIRNTLFTLPSESLQETVNKYQELCPQPLTHMFPDRLPKEEAIQQKKKMNLYQTKLEPSGKSQESICVLQ